MRAIVVSGVLIISVVGCGSPQDETYSVIGNAGLYFDEDAFRGAGADPDIGKMIDLIKANKLKILGNGARIRVIDRTAGGAKVQVISGEDEGKTGWITEKDLERSGKG